MTEKICPKCQTENPIEANFCRHCGHEFPDSKYKVPVAVKEIIKYVPKEKIVEKVVYRYRKNPVNRWLVVVCVGLLLYILYDSCTNNPYQTSVEDKEVAVIDTVVAEDSSIQKGIDKKSIITDSIASNYNDVSVGDYFYDDGTISSVNIPSKHCVGIVFTTCTSEIEQKRGWTHGMIVALKNAEDNSALDWGGDYNHLTQKCRSSVIAKKDIDGYKHCFLEGEEKPGDREGAFLMAKQYNAKLPKNTSGWYLPSVGQWNLILRNLLSIGFDENFSNTSYSVKESLKLRQGNYWTSTEYGSTSEDVKYGIGIGVNAWNICVYKRSIRLEVSCKGLVCYVRPVASF